MISIAAVGVLGVRLVRDKHLGTIANADEDVCTFRKRSLDSSRPEDAGREIKQLPDITVYIVHVPSGCCVYTP